MRFVDFTPEYISAVVELQKECFADGWNENMLKAAFEGGRYFGCLAFEGERLAAFIGCTLGYDDCDLEGVAVLPEFRRKGVADALLDTVHERALLLGRRAFLLEVREGNAPARTLYQKHGYEAVAVRKRYYSDGENAVVMKKEL